MAIGKKYSGIWTRSQQMRAISAGTWKNIPLPSLFTWGENTTGELGLDLGVNAFRSSPIQVGTTADWSKLATDNFRTWAIKTNGSLWGFGSNYSGNLGNNTSTPAGGPSQGYSSPIQIGTDTNWYQISAFDECTFALRTNGTLWGWGDESNTGNIGRNSTYKFYSSPVQIGALSTWSWISSGQGGFAVKNDSTLWTWGRNQYGTLGLGTSGAYTHKSSPVQIGGAVWAQAGSRNFYNTAAIRTDGTLWIWGSNGQYGIFGNGNSTNAYSPVQSGTDSNWSQVSTSGFAVSAIKTNGTLWSWGYNGDGRLGDNTTISRSSPVQIGSGTNWAKVTCARAGDFTMALKTDGTLWAWGRNDQNGTSNRGGLGINSSINQSSPVQVGTLSGWTDVEAGGQHHTAAILGVLS